MSNVSSVGPSSERKTLLSISAVHQLFNISIVSQHCLRSTLRLYLYERWTTKPFLPTLFCVSRPVIASKIAYIP